MENIAYHPSDWHSFSPHARRSCIMDYKDGLGEEWEVHSTKGAYNKRVAIYSVFFLSSLNRFIAYNS